MFPRVVRNKGGLRTVSYALIVCIGVVLALVFVLQMVDRLYGQSVAQALRYAYQDLTNQDERIERRAQVLRDQIAEQLQLPVLRTVGFSMHGGLYQDHFLARFNPAAWRISFSPQMYTLDAQQIDHIILHELGHAVLILAGARPEYGSHEQTRAYLQSSTLAQQMFHEAYADTFALFWHLRMDPQAWYPREVIRRAQSQPEIRASVAHDTFLALRLGAFQAAFMHSTPKEQVLPQVQAVASKATALSIAHQRLEREAGCAIGLRGVARYARDFAYASALLPWQVAPESAAQPGEPFYEAIAELQTLRPQTPSHNRWRAALARTAPTIEQAIEYSLAHGVEPNRAAYSTVLYLQKAYSDVLTDEMFAARFAVRENTRYRQSTVRTWAHDSLLFVAQRLHTPQTQGCVD